MVCDPWQSYDLQTWGPDIGGEILLVPPELVSNNPL